MQTSLYFNWEPGLLGLKEQSEHRGRKDLKGLLVPVDLRGLRVRKVLLGLLVRKDLRVP
jgi:hypothetical protein